MSTMLPKPVEKEAMATVLLSTFLCALCSFLNFIYYCCVYDVCTTVCTLSCTWESRGQPAGVNSRLRLWVWGVELGSLGLHSKGFYPLSHPRHPTEPVLTALNSLVCECSTSSMIWCVLILPARTLLLTLANSA